MRLCDSQVSAVPLRASEGRSFRTLPNRTMASALHFPTHGRAPDTQSPEKHAKAGSMTTPRLHFQRSHPGAPVGRFSDLSGASIRKKKDDRREAYRRESQAHWANRVVSVEDGRSSVAQISVCYLLSRRSEEGEVPRAGGLIFSKNGQFLIHGFESSVRMQPTLREQK